MRRQLQRYSSANCRRMPDPRKNAGEHCRASHRDDALRAWESAEYRRCLDVLGDDESADALTLNASALLRLARNEDVISVLGRRPDRFWGKAGPLIHAFRGAALLRSGDATEGRREMREACLRAEGAEPSVAAEVHYYAAQSAWITKDLDEAESFARRVDPSMDVLYVRALDLLGFVAMSREDFQSASRYFSLALSEYRRCSRRDEHLRGSVLASVMMLAVELLDKFLVEQVSAMRENVAWTSEMNAKRFVFEHYRGKLALLNGDPDSAYDSFETASSVAPTRGQRAMAKLDLADLEIFINEPFAARRWLSSAFRDVEGVTWSSTDAEERMALLTLARTSSRLGVSTGSNSLIRYLSAKEPQRSLAALNSDARTQAFEYEARGHVARGLGETATARSWFVKSLDEWRRLRLRFRCVQVGAELAKIGDDVAQQDLRDFRKSWPESLIPQRTPSTEGARSATSRRRKTELPKLGPAEQRVYEKLCEGKSSALVASELGKSVHTINNQTRRIFKTFGVKTRAALVADHARRLD